MHTAIRALLISVSPSELLNSFNIMAQGGVGKIKFLN